MSPLAVLGYLNGRREEADQRGGTLAALTQGFALLSPIRAIVACPEMTLFVIANAAFGDVTLTPSCLHLRIYVPSTERLRSERRSRQVEEESEIIVSFIL